MTSNGNDKKSWIEIAAVIAGVLGAIAALLTALLGDGGLTNLLKSEKPQETDTTPTSSKVTDSPTVGSGDGSVKTGGVNVNPVININPVIKSEGSSVGTGETIANPILPIPGEESRNSRETVRKIGKKEKSKENVSEQPAQVSDITRDEYDAIQNGMTYEQVVQIIGSPGQTDGTNGPFTFFKWDDGGHFGVRMTFLDGKLTSKSPYGFGS